MDSLVLGIDAAWTPWQPSGIALVAVTTGNPPELLRIARSCAEFTSNHQNGTGDWLGTLPTERTVNLSEILDATKRCSGAEPNVIALDIPLSPLGVHGRRAADNAISREYGGRWAGTHTPSAKRPGPVSDALFQQLSRSGYCWASDANGIQVGRQARCFLETYPHPAIIEMLGLDKRLCYKVAKRQRYWPGLMPDKRWKNIALELDRLHDALASRIGGFADRVPKACAILDSGPKSKGTALKGIEDALDAVVCALVGCHFLRGSAVAFGDGHSAIWIPHYPR